MDFQKIRTIESPKFYLDVAFSYASKKTDEFRDTKARGSTKLLKSKTIEIQRIEFVRERLVKKLKVILDDFPDIDKLDVFYQELIKATLDYASMKKSLGSIKWAVDQVNGLLRKYKEKIKMTQKIGLINKHRKGYYGRVSSLSLIHI